MHFELGRDFCTERKTVISKHGKGKAASRPFTHPDRQPPLHAPRKRKKISMRSCKHLREMVYYELIK